jgi:hypothetical protein
MIHSKILLFFVMVFTALFLVPISYSVAQESTVTYFVPHEDWRELKK